MTLTRRHFLALAASSAMPLPRIEPTPDLAAAKALGVAYGRAFDQVADAMVDLFMQPPIPQALFEALRRDAEFRAVEIAGELVRGIVAETISPADIVYRKVAVPIRPERREVRRRNAAASRRLKAAK